MFKNKTRLISLLIFLLLPPILIPTILMSRPVVMLNYDGICPAAPTDIPARPCTEEEYYNRIAKSPFAIASFFIYGFLWFAGVGLIVMIVFTIRWFRRSKS